MSSPVDENFLQILENEGQFPTLTCSDIEEKAKMLNFKSDLHLCPIQVQKTVLTQTKGQLKRKTSLHFLSKSVSDKLSK